MRVLEFNSKRIIIEVPFEEVDQVVKGQKNFSETQIPLMFAKYVRLITEFKKKQSKERLNLRQQLNNERLIRDLQGEIHLNTKRGPK